MEDPSANTSVSSPALGQEPSPSPHPSMSIDKLFPALLECFGIILCGYAAGRANIITSTQSKGLGNFVSRFALPALLFKNMVLLDFGNVIWPFLWSILVAKLSVFFIVFVITLLVASKDNRFSKAGLFSIFATQSNDFALGYPIVEALYRNTHPEYMQYIYLVAPVSLMVLNPIGFAFCEVQKRRGEQGQQSKLRVVGVVILQVLRNPIVFMVIIGIASHFLLGQKIPPVLEEFVDGLANSFGGAALFYLGLTMVGQLKKLTKSTVVALILLITAKLLVMPLICRGMVEVLDNGNVSAVNHTSLSNYAFLYGVFPTAPSVAIYAAHYNMELQVVTSGMVISTFLSAPIMYVSAWLLTIPWMDPKPLASALQHISFNISIVSLFALVWCVAVSIMSKKFHKLPHVFTVNLFVAQLGVCVGMIAWNFVVVQENFIGQILTFSLLYGSLYSTYIWPGLIALSLFLLRRDEEKVKPGFIIIAGWGVPVIALSILLMVGKKMPDTIDSAFFFGTAQIICTSLVLSVGIVLAGVSLMLLSRGTQGYQTLEHEPLNGTVEDVRADDCVQPCCTIEPPSIEDDIRRNCQGCECSCASVQPTPDTLINKSMKDRSSAQTGSCGSCTETSQCLLVEEEQKWQSADRQVARHVLLCLLLTVSLLANLSSCLWWLLSEVPGRLYLELQFFCAVVNFGQGFLSFGIFGLDKHLIILPFKKRLARLMHAYSQESPGQSDVSEEIRLTCSQFLKYHKEQCIQDIVQKKKCGKRSVAETFLGSEMVEWLQTVGLASDQGEALLYGSRLLEGGVIHHITYEYGFQDDTLYYRFTENMGK